MSPQNDTPQDNDEATAKATIAKAIDDHLSVIGNGPLGNLLAGRILEALKKAGWLLVRADRYRVDVTAVGGQLGVSKGLPGLGNGLTRITRKMTSVGQEAGAGFVGAFEPIAPGATQAAKTGFDLVNRTIDRRNAQAAQRAIDAEAELAAALDLIGRRSDIVAVQLPEPDKTSPPEDWNFPDAYWEPQHDWHAVSVEDGMVDVGCQLLTPDQTRGVAAIWLAAAARADAANAADTADGGEK